MISYSLCFPVFHQSVALCPKYTFEAQHLASRTSIKKKKKKVFPISSAVCILNKPMFSLRFIFFFVDTLKYNAGRGTEKYCAFSFQAAHVHCVLRLRDILLLSINAHGSVPLEIVYLSWKSVPGNQGNYQIRKKKHIVSTMHISMSTIIYIHSHSVPANICFSYKNGINPSLHTLVNSEFWQQFKLQQQGARTSRKGIWLWKTSSKNNILKERNSRKSTKQEQYHPSSFNWKRKVKKNMWPDKKSIVSSSCDRWFKFSCSC